MLLLIGGLVGLTIGVGLTVLYFSLATFFAANAKTLDRDQEATEKMAMSTQKAQQPARDKRMVG